MEETTENFFFVFYTNLFKLVAANSHYYKENTYH